MTFIENLGMVRDLGYVLDLTDTIGFDPDTRDRVLRESDPNYWDLLPDDPRSIVRIRAYSVPCIIGLGDFDAYIAWRDAVTEYPEPTFERIMKGVNA